MVVAAEAGVHPPPTESDTGTNVSNNDDGSTGQPPSGGEDKLLLAMCRTIRKETGWQERTLRQACDWATGASSGWEASCCKRTTYFLLPWLLYTAAAARWLYNVKVSRALKPCANILQPQHE